jgi:hypothetical protein
MEVLYRWKKCNPDSFQQQNRTGISCSTKIFILFENELKKDDEPISYIIQRIDSMCDIFKNVSSFKILPKRSELALKIIKEDKKEVEHTAVEKIKMLRDIYLMFLLTICIPVIVSNKECP